MEINLDATRERFRETGRTVAGWSRSKNFIPSSVHGLLSGTFPYTGDKGREIISEMEKDGLLVRAA